MPEACMSPRNGLTEIVSSHVTAPPHRQSMPLQIRGRFGDLKFMSLWIQHLCCELSLAGKCSELDGHPRRVNTLLAGNRQVPCRPIPRTRQGSSTPKHPLRSSQLHRVPLQALPHLWQGLPPPGRTSWQQTQPCTPGDGLL